jgi:hypothetical protein
MSVTVDANILVYASNEADPVHLVARGLLERLAAGPDLFYVFWPTLLGYLRIVTHPGILPTPLQPAEALANAEVLIAPSHVRSVGEAEGFWRLFRGTAGEQVRGNDVPDAHLAALMRQNGVRVIYTRDRGYRRFPDITAVDPFAAPTSPARS